MPDSPKVILLIENSRQFGRDLLRGIAQYSKLHRPWNVYRLPPYYLDVSSRAQKIEISHLADWGANGVIMREVASVDDVLALGIPTIISFSSNKVSQYPEVPKLLTDDYSVGRMGAEHLLERGFKQFAFVDYFDFYWSDARGRGFCDVVADAGFTVHYYRQPATVHQRLWDIEQKVMIEWLRELPKPVGLMSCIDERSQDVIEACKQAGVRVPEEIAIIGGDNDELICELSNPQLSSVAVGGVQAGYEAARVLDQLMKGQTPEKTVIPVRATHVVTRHSTDVLAVNDPEVAEALRFIRSAIQRPLQVEDVAEHVSMTRQGLNKKFNKSIGRSIHDEIALARIHYVKRLLIETNMTVSDIARAAGQLELKQLSRFFKKHTGASPLEFRRRTAAHQGARSGP